MRRIIAAVAITLSLCGVAAGEVADLGDLGSEDLRAVAAAVTTIEHAPPAADADALFAAGRACEDKLANPARALAIYERIVRDTADARVAVAATRRIEALRSELGDHGEHGAEAAAFAQLVAEADSLADGEVTRRADALATTAWPGAPATTLWLAEWLRRHARFDEAQARYAETSARWPASPQAGLAQRGAAGCAIDARDWDRAQALARELPATLPADRIVRAKLLAAAAHGRHRNWIYDGAWLALVLALVALLGSLLEAAARHGWRRPPLWPPGEVLFLAPVAAVLVAVSFTAHRTIAPAVLRISVVGLALTWLSGAALDVLRGRGRAFRLRAVLHIFACAIGVIAIGYIAMTRDGLLDLLVETVRFGPES